ncbi:MAG: RsmD family RNA methyltransferase [Acidobacteria bacterium]|nr:RsmD family RNA methyltransferase [Acidobacteriota bacterium]MBK8150410.1 RsmD family RNA methyltransferase [Acidobacteriota bacterium]MBK8811407.1 RsmD family RNA methyltransferase [Acidobacteriota bacterium]
MKIVSEFQVTDGKLRGKFLKGSASPKAAMTPQKLREAMFKILFRRIRAKRFLDLCAGSGMIGIEAISRGAIVATFVERSPKMCSFIRKNMETCEIKAGHGEVVELEVMPFLKQMGKRRRFWDVVYLDAPVEKEFDEAMKYLSRGTAISPGGTLVVEHPAEVFLPERAGVLKRWRVVVQGEKAISFFERK